MDQIIYCSIVAIIIALFAILSVVGLLILVKLINSAKNNNRLFHIVAFFLLLFVFVVGSVALTQLLIKNINLI
jgi:hypothetical protein